MSQTERPPDYDRTIDAAELLADLADLSQYYADEYVEKRQWWNDYIGRSNDFEEARWWMLEALGGRQAITDAMVQIHPDGECRNNDGTVALRAFMRYVTDQADRAHDRAHGAYSDTRRADEAETAYAKVLTLLRDDYGVGWPRVDDIGGNALSQDLP